jgi:hypothetical protein
VTNLSSAPVTGIYAGLGSVSDASVNGFTDNGFYCRTCYSRAEHTEVEVCASTQYTGAAQKNWPVRGVQILMGSDPPSNIGVGYYMLGAGMMRTAGVTGTARVNRSDFVGGDPFLGVNSGNPVRVAIAMMQQLDNGTTRTVAQNKRFGCAVGRGDESAVMVSANTPYSDENLYAAGADTYKVFSGNVILSLDTANPGVFMGKSSAGGNAWDANDQLYAMMWGCNRVVNPGIVWAFAAQSSATINTAVDTAAIDAFIDTLPDSMPCLLWVNLGTNIDATDYPVIAQWKNTLKTYIDRWRDRYIARKGIIPMILVESIHDTSYVRSNPDTGQVWSPLTSGNVGTSYIDLQEGVEDQTWQIVQDYLATGYTAAHLNVLRLMPTFGPTGTSATPAWTFTGSPLTGDGVHWNLAGSNNIAVPRVNVVLADSMLSRPTYGPSAVFDTGGSGSALI